MISRCKLILLLTVAVFFISVVCGCAKERFPRVDPGTVKGFDMGSAKVPKLESKPTAEELYDVLVKYYGSFDSCAASVTTTLTSSHPALPETNHTYPVEYRYSSPDKDFELRDGDMAVSNGKESIWYWSDTGKYTNLFTATSYRDCDGSFMMWLSLPCHHDNPSMRLLPEMAIDKTPVYVLEVKVEADKEIHWRTETHTIYVGTVDLLPRKAISITTTKDKKGRVARTEWVDVFKGVKVNVAIPDELFSIKPPKGAKPMKESRNK